MQRLASPALGGKRASTAGITVQHRCTASAGLHLFAEHEGEVDALLEEVDAAMYRAKASGRNLLRMSAEAHSARTGDPHDVHEV